MQTRPLQRPVLSSEEVGRRGQELYENRLRAQVGTEENLGKMISIDIDTGDYEIDDVGLAAAERLLSKHPDAAIYGTRIGYDAVYALGPGTAIERTMAISPALMRSYRSYST